MQCLHLIEKGYCNLEWSKKVNRRSKTGAQFLKSHSKDGVDPIILSRFQFGTLF